MQTTQHVPSRTGMIVLNESLRDPQLREGLLVVALQEESPLVAEHARLENDDARQRSRNLSDGIHRSLRPWNRGHLRIPFPAKAAANTLRSCCSSWCSRSSPPVPL